MAMNPVTYVGNASSGGNAKSSMVMAGASGVQVPGAVSQASLGLGDAANRLRGGVFGGGAGVLNYGVTPKMGG